MRISGEGILTMNKPSPEMRSTDSSGNGSEELREEGKEQATGNRKQKGTGANQMGFPLPCRNLGVYFEWEGF